MTINDPARSDRGIGGTRRDDLGVGRKTSRKRGRKRDRTRGRKRGTVLGICGTGSMKSFCNFVAVALFAGGERMEHTFIRLRHHFHGDVEHGGIGVAIFDVGHGYGLWVIDMGGW
jgi:hypothetical protein